MEITFEQIFGYAKSFIKKADDVLGAINNIKTIKRKGNALSSQIEELFELECEFRNKIKNYPSDNSRSLLGITKNHDELLSVGRISKFYLILLRGLKV